MRDRTEVGAFEAEIKFSILRDRVEKGEEIVITRNGLAIAKLVPVEREHTADERRAAIERITRLADKRTLEGISWKTQRDTGRKY